MSAPEELHNQESSPYSCAICRSEGNLKRCVDATLSCIVPNFVKNKYWYKHKHSWQQNQDVVEVLETDGYKQLVGKTQSRRLQRPYNPGFDLPTNESRERYGSYPMRRSDGVELPIRYSIILFDLGFIVLSFLFLLIFIFGSFLFLLCFCLCFLAYLSQRLKWTFLIKICPFSVVVIGDGFVADDVVLNISYFHLFLKNHRVNFNQT